MALPEYLQASTFVRQKIEDLFLSEKHTLPQYFACCPQRKIRLSHKNRPPDMDRLESPFPIEQRSRARGKLALVCSHGSGIEGKI